MLRRLLPTLIGLGVALGLLGWGLAALLQVFGAERQAARDAVEARQIALAQYGRAALLRRLERRLVESVAAATAAERDPLAPDAGLYLRRDGEVRLPRRRAYAAGEGRGALDLYATLLDPTASPTSLDPQGPWAERLALRRRIIDAQGAGDPGGVERAFRELLAHRARFVVAAVHEVPYLAALLTWFEGTGDADPELLRILLHRGAEDPSAGRIESLQRLLLRRRAAFTVSEFEGLVAQVAALSAAVRAPTDRFRAEAAIDAAKLPGLPNVLREPMLVDQGAWYVAPVAGNVRGIAIDVAGMLTEIAAEMYAGSLFDLGDALTLEPFDAHPIRTLPVVADSPQWARALSDAERAYVYKRGLVLVCAALALCLAALAVLGQYRKRRFLSLKSDFISTVSHELRTPLAAVRVMAETLERRLVDEPKARDYPTRIVRTVDGLSFLVENILSFNRLDKGRWVPELRRTTVGAAIESVRGHLAELHPKPVTWNVTGDLDAPLTADAELLQLLYMNLARNSALYNERDPVELHVSARAEPKRVVVRFTDNGVGIPAEAQPHIFIEFYRARAGQARGSGLGLALCQRIMALHRGTIRLVETGPDGTTFELRHPR